MLERRFKVGTRTSPLALKQVEEVLGALKKVYPQFQAEIVGIETYGDKDKSTPISDIEGTDFFTREIDSALLEGRIEFAVHSAKDMPDELCLGLSVAAFTKSIDRSDALVSKGNLKIDELQAGAAIGASSARRKEQLKRYRSDLQVVDIRGNIAERLQILDRGSLDGILVASCALMRLGLEKRIAQRLSEEDFPAHPLQGSLAVVARKVDKELIEYLKVLDGK